MWVPLFYTIAFAIIARVLGSSIFNHAALYWVGLIVSFVVSLGVSFYRHEKKKQMKREKRARRKGNFDGGERVYEKGGASGQQMHICPFYKSGFSGSQPYRDEEVIEHELKHPSYKVFNADGEEVYDEYDEYDEGGAEEVPKVFALKSDPSVFICEYNNRLEYYKHTRGGMVLMETKRK